MRPRTLAFTLLAPLAVAAAVAGPASAADESDVVAAGSTAVTLAPTHSASAVAAPATSRTHHRSGTQALPKIKGEVGPGFTITINKAKVPAGKYKFVVNDLSSMHNFHLTGAGVDEKTEVPFTGKVTWKLKLKKGTYTAVCDPHAESMRTSLKVTA